MTPHPALLVRAGLKEQIGVIHTVVATPSRVRPVALPASGHAMRQTFLAISHAPRALRRLSGDAPADFGWQRSPRRTEESKIFERNVMAGRRPRAHGSLVAR